MRSIQKPLKDQIHVVSMSGGKDSLNKKKHLVKGFTVYDYLEYCNTFNKSGRPRKNYDFYFCNTSEGMCE